jgi:hypothetical protein
MWQRGRPTFEGCGPRARPTASGVRLELLAKVVSDIESYVQLSEVNLPEHAVTDTADGAEPEVAAARVREAWRLGRGPIDNVVRLLEAQGIVVVRPRVGGSDVDAFSTWVTGRPVVVLGSDKADAARSRFDAPHELGHLGACLLPSTNDCRCLRGDAEVVEEGLHVEA